MPTTTVENYLKKLYVMQQGSDGALVSMGCLAERMEVTPGTATSMIQVMAKSSLVQYSKGKGTRLTPRGEQLALHVLRRHRLIELFLVKVLDLDWSEVHAEAERLEHALSDKLLQRIDEFLGAPTVDPHGDPIPNADGEIADRAMMSLSGCRPGAVIKIARVVDQNPAFLRHLQEYGLVPGNKVTVKKVDRLADAVTVRAARSSALTLGIGAAARIFVEPVVTAKVPIEGRRK